ncbi:hypothetical protein D9613_009526 [Agrocybe pediades]|uniref:Uncharacterized protein n=1 Tax=Agrocybe pediades TaxID=84607 RepID=A0A8H4VTC4_9AGAR|nr:hypothetical protein D9613_009526 [Agrocybe pediades]
MSRFSVSRYNNLLGVDEADKKLNKQLADAKISRHDFFSQLANLFLEENRHIDYSPCLLHRHFLLEEGEKMVADGNSTMPSTDDSVVPERWYPDGEEMEHRVANPNIALPPPPPPEFMAKFKALTQRYGIDVLGVCYVPPVEELPPMSIFRETLGSRDREEVIQVVPKDDSSLGGPFYASCWVVTRGMETCLRGRDRTRITEGKFTSNENVQIVTDTGYESFI